MCPSSNTPFPGLSEGSKGGATCPLQGQNQAQAHTKGFGSKKSNIRVEVGECGHSVNPGSLSTTLFSLDTRTIHDENEILGDQDAEKYTITLTGKYAKYAGEAPDGGLKAWSVILGFVSYHV